jgi:ApaG protein
MQNDESRTNRPGPRSSQRDERQPGRAPRGEGREGYVKTTRGVRISVRSFFLDDQSHPDDNHFVWAYRVKVENNGRETVQLLRRTWQITDARGRTQHVHGIGVVGEQPVLEPGESFEYTSGTPLDTPSGFMVGAYHRRLARVSPNLPAGFAGGPTVAARPARAAQQPPEEPDGEYRLAEAQPCHRGYRLRQ